MWGKLAPGNFQVAQWDGDFSYALSALAPLCPDLPQLKAKRKSLGRFILHPNLMCPCLVCGLPSSLPYLYPGAQISTVGSVKPFFPSFTSTGFSVRVCQTRICVSRDMKQHGAGPPDLSLPPPCSLPRSASTFPAPPVLSLFHQDFLHCSLFLPTPPHSCCLYINDAFKISVGNKKCVATKDRQVSSKISSCFSSSPVSS